MEIITLLFMLLAASYILGQVFKKLKFPQVLGPIIVGLLINTFYPGYLNDNETLGSFANLGLIFIMFYVGLELDLKSFFKKPKNILIISTANIIVPFIVSFIVMKLLGFSYFVCFITGLILSVTAEAVSVEILKEYNMLKSKLGETIILSATFDDIIEIFLLSAITVFAEKGELTIVVFLFNILIFFAVIYIVRFLIIPYILEYLGGKSSKTQLFIVGTLMVLLVSIIAEYLGFGELIGALIAGLIVKYTLLQDFNEKQEQQDMTELFEAVTFGFLAPFFFIWIGLNTDLTIIIKTPTLGIILTILAIGTKVIGSLLGNYIVKGKTRDSIIIGVALANKGVVELVAAEIARKSGLISQELFTSIVFMAVLTTILTPIILGFLLKKSTNSENAQLDNSITTN